MFTRFFGKPSEARQFPRIKRLFKVAFSHDGKSFDHAHPVDISLGGIGLLVNAELPGEVFTVNVHFGAMNLTGGVERVSFSKGTLKGEQAWRIGTRFVDIAEDDRELVDRFVQGLPVDPAEQLRAGLQALNANPDDAMDLLPKVAVKRCLDALVKKNRLAPVHPDQTPLVRFHYTGPTYRNGPERLHGVKIESRVMGRYTSIDYVTQIYFNEKLTRFDVVPMDKGK